MRFYDLFQGERAPPQPDWRLQWQSLCGFGRGRSALTAPLGALCVALWGARASARPPLARIPAVCLQGERCSGLTGHAGV